MKHIHPLISIVIPVFNREDLISDCINSCLNQTYYNFEIIVLTTTHQIEHMKLLRVLVKNTIILEFSSKNKMLDL